MPFSSYIGAICSLNYILMALVSVHGWHLFLIHLPSKLHLYLNCTHISSYRPEAACKSSTIKEFYTMGSNWSHLIKEISKIQRCWKSLRNQILFKWTILKHTNIHNKEFLREMFMNKNLKSKKKFNKNLNKLCNIFHYFKTPNICVKNRFFFCAYLLQKENVEINRGIFIK